MSDNLHEFELSLKEFSEKHIPAEVGRMRNALALEGIRTLAFLTPVDTGRARGNYQLTIGAPAEGYNPEAFDKTGQSAAARSAETLSASKDPWDVVWIHNGVPYITYLNDGTPPHVIEAKNARFLRFKQGGKWVYRKMVHHPGTPAFHMLEQTVERLTSIANSMSAERLP